MMSDETLLVTTARNQAGQMRSLSEVLIPLLLAAICLPLIGDVYLTATDPAPWASELGAPLAVVIKLIGYAPALCAAAAVVALRAVFVEYQAGRFLSARASKAFKRAGLFALAAFLLEIFIAPIAISLLGGPAFNWRFDPLDVALMAFSIFVLMIGGVLEAVAASLKAENDEIV
jgi:hypothetical protein